MKKRKSKRRKGRSSGGRQTNLADPKASTTVVFEKLEPRMLLSAKRGDSCGADVRLDFRAHDSSGQIHGAVAHADSVVAPAEWGNDDREGAPESNEAKVMVLMRGLPSCGKTFAATELAAGGGVHIEFDEYFYKIIGDEPSKYDWSYDLMPKAREWNLERIVSAVDAKASPIIVDSDNVPGPFTRGYVAYAMDRGYEIRFHEPETEWWRAIRELLKDKQSNAQALRSWAQTLTRMSKSTHRVPLTDILRRINRWEEASVERILAVA